MSEITANIVVSMPSQLFTLADRFAPAAGGSIFIGKIDIDPSLIEQPENQIQVYLEPEDGILVPVPQPIKIDAAGYPEYNGSAAKFVTVAGHSMLVKNYYGVQQFYFPNVQKFDPARLEQRLAEYGGATLIGDVVAPNVQAALASREYILDSVTTMKAMDFTHAPENYYIKTLANEYGVAIPAHWQINSAPKATTYSIKIGNKYANLMVEKRMNFAMFSFGGTDVANAATVEEGNRVARANPKVKKLSFPYGTYSIADFTLDVDRRSFIWDGAGWDATYLIATGNNISMHHVIMDKRDRARDREHFYQRVEGFTIDGNISGNGANAAQRTVCSAHYSRLGYKSVGHRVSNVDICGLEVRWFGHTQGRVSSDGTVYTLNGLRVRYNSVKVDGYVGGAKYGTTTWVNTAIHGPSNTLSGANVVGATSINLTSAVGFYAHDVIELGGGPLEAKIITEVSGNTLKLDSALEYVHASGGTIRVPVYGTSVTGTLEVGQIQIGNCSACEIRGMYSEESRIYIYALAEALEIHGNTIGEAVPAITIDSTVSRYSSIRIVANQTSFPITVNIANRDGVVDANLDLYNFPQLDIQQNTRAQNSILVNGMYAFKSLKVSRGYNTGINDAQFTHFKFEDFCAVQASSSATEVLRFYQDSTLRGYDGHTYDLTAVIRRNSGLSGIIKRAGQTSIIGTAVSDTSAANSRTLNNYAFFDATNGMDLLMVTASKRAGLVLKGEPVGGQAITAMISGEVVSVL